MAEKITIINSDLGLRRTKMRDLGLSYEQAAHGVQTAIAHDMANGRKNTEIKHMRVGIDMRAADMLGLAELLIDKGVFTVKEYKEYMRLAANEELAMRENEQGITFR